MSIVSTICFVFFILILASMLKKGSDPLSPGRIFMLIWFGAIGLADFKFSGYQYNWTLYSWLVLVVGLASFLLGLFVCYTLFITRPAYSVAEIRNMPPDAHFNKEKAYHYILLLFLAYAVCYAIELIVIGSLPIFAVRADRARIDYGIFGIHLIVTSMPTLLFLIIEYFILVRSEKSRKQVLGVIFAVTMVTFFLILQRFLFVAWALMSLCFFYYASPRFKFRWIGLTILMFYGMLQYLLSFRVALYVKNFVYVISRMKYSEQYAIFTEPYMYIVMNIENFTHGVDKLDGFTYGYFTADPILALTGLKHWMADYYNLVERPFLASSFNTFPFLWPSYYDFGIIGVALIPFAIGATIGLSYYRMRTAPTPFNVALYSLCFYFIVISFFTNPLTMLTTLFNFILLMVIQHLISVPDADAQAARTI